jgi:hypothetical protein
MVAVSEALRVLSTPDRFYPRAFFWQGRMVRVRAVEQVRTFGQERRFRVRTAEGCFELGVFPEAGVWRLRRTPGVLGRFWARWHSLPRYPLPPWRRRQSARPALSVSAAFGGWAAVVR